MKMRDTGRFSPGGLPTSAGSDGERAHTPLAQVQRVARTREAASGGAAGRASLRW